MQKTKLRIQEERTTYQWICVLITVKTPLLTRHCLKQQTNNLFTNIFFKKKILDIFFRIIKATMLTWWSFRQIHIFFSSCSEWMVVWQSAGWVLNVLHVSWRSKVTRSLLEYLTSVMVYLGCKYFDNKLPDALTDCFQKTLTPQRGLGTKRQWMIYLPKSQYLRVKNPTSNILRSWNWKA